MEDKILTSLLEERIEIRDTLLFVRITLLNIQARLGIKGEVELTTNWSIDDKDPLLKKDIFNNKILLKLSKELLNHSLNIDKL